MTHALAGAERALTADDATIRAMLEGAHIAALMAALVHLEGGTEILCGTIRPLPDLFGYDEDGLSPEQRAGIRERAFEALCAYRDAGCRLPPPPDGAALRAIVDFIGGEPPPPGTHGMLLEELALDGDPRAPDFSDIPAARRAACRVLVIGAGMSGILAAYRCLQAGLAVTVLEKNPRATGTWFENTYPGCRVDSYNHVYAYSFLPYNAWPMYFSTREDIARYFEHCIDRFGVRERIRPGVTVEAADWDEGRALWVVEARGADGGAERHEAEVLISATGQLNIPRMPSIPGLESFAGPAFHSARWDHAVDLAGKRVAVIGTGASATQFVPEIVDRVAELRVFQRSPPWLLPTPRYHQPIPAAQRWLFEHVPYYERWYRLWTFRTNGVDGALPYLCSDPGWNDGGRSVSEKNAELRTALVDYLRAQLAERPDLLATAVPDYPPGGKRPLRDCGAWLGALQRPNARLVTERIEAITPTGVRTADGEEHAADVLIHGTGFHADRFLWPMRITGRDGAGLSARWRDAPRAYKGLSVPQFPNLFVLYGPNTNIVVGSSIIFFTECSLRYAMQAIGALLRGAHRSLEVRPEVHDAWNARIDAANARMAWGAPNVASWYKNAAGHVTQNWPGTHLGFWEETRRFDPADYVLR
jgi:4-hydroxyacetophenone monooxygenase